eukprot:CAMPEP_0172584482 /NCGR_PEP_ID=MMETSP1068-20121228/4080_1 /TAXON_ID=35684 /ORGANISM="Pseudopedinella elastica, Strain CCMP716" /LENGTH=514 /DNA_ID=CAMNT_0013378681 /DNA_START=31 /DNA_END=1575 /DNA_ORIENTATION=-
MRNPPWGVTANLCTRSRTISRNFNFFSRTYPRTGGGEDVDFCIRSKSAGHGRIVGVPAAKVVHPYWNSPFAQIAGWAQGDVLCLGQLPHVAFYTPPNWAELALGCLVWGLYRFYSEGAKTARAAFTWALLAPIVEVVMLFPRFYWFAQGLPKNRVLVALLAATPPMLQDVVRLVSKLKRCRLQEVCQHFDWMNKSGHHPEEIRSHICWKLVEWLAVGWAVQSTANREVAVSAALIIYTTWIVRHCGSLLVAEWKPPVARRHGLGVEIEAGKVPFVLLAYQRTGSNMLVRNHLNKHPDIHMHFELFNEKAIYTQSHPGVTTPGAIRNIDKIRARDKNPAAFLSQIISESPTTAVGFKLFPEHVTDLDFLEQLLADRRIRKVILRRENQLGCVTSIVRATVTGEYIKVSHDKVPVHISAADFQAFSEGYERYYTFLRDRLAGQSYHEITYESVVADAEKALRPVYKSLGVSGPSSKPPALPGDLQPQSTGVLRNALANYEELSGVFASTERHADFT